MLCLFVRCSRIALTIVYCKPSLIGLFEDISAEPVEPSSRYPVQHLSQLISNKPFPFVPLCGVIHVHGVTLHY